MHLSVAAEGNSLTGFHGDSYSHADRAGGQDVRAPRGEFDEKIFHGPGDRARGLDSDQFC